MSSIAIATLAFVIAVSSMNIAGAIRELAKAIKNIKKPK